MRLKISLHEIGTMPWLFPYPICFVKRVQTYHGVGLACAGLAVREEAAVVALPGIVKHLLAERIVDELLVGVLTRCRDHDAIFVDAELVVRPK